MSGYLVRPKPIACALRADLDLGQRTARLVMRVDRRRRRVPLKTASSRRTLELPGSLVAVLAAHELSATDTRPGAFVFASETGTALQAQNVARRGLWAACRAAGVPEAGPHALRHAHASALLEDG